MQGKVDDRQEAQAKMSADVPIVSTNCLCEYSKENSNLGWKTTSGGRNTEDVGKQRI